MNERFKIMQITETENSKIKDKFGKGEKVVLDKATMTIFVPFMTLEGFEHFYGKLEEIKEE